MAICSYLAYPMDGQKEKLRNAIMAVYGCQVLEADRHDLLIVLTETNSKEADQALQDALSRITSLKCLALAFVGNNQTGVK